MTNKDLISPFIQSFFNERLIAQMNASSNTIAAYRDTFKILFEFINIKLKKSPSELLVTDLNSNVISSFLIYLQKERKNNARTCNARLAAVHSFFKYLEFKKPQILNQIQQVLSIPQKKYEKKVISYLTDNEIKSLLKTPDRKKWIGRRDYTLLLLAIQTGLRVSELVNLTVGQLKFGTGAHIKCTGKGRKERCTPLTKQTIAALKEWLKEINEKENDYLFPSSKGSKLNRDTIDKLLKKYVEIAEETCPTFKGKIISPHSLRHTTAMLLLHSKVDCSVIALFLGHESLETTQIYIKADLDIKEKAIAKVKSMDTKFKRFKADDKLIEFLKAL